MNIYYTVYKTINILNQHIYVGVHKTSNPNDEYLGSGLNITRAIKKYGKENFKKEILHICESRKEAYLLESQIVNKDFVSRTNTYNINVGGDCPPPPDPKSHSIGGQAMWEKFRSDPEFAESLREKRKSQINPMLGKKQKRTNCPNCGKDLPVNGVKTHLKFCK